VLLGLLSLGISPVFACTPTQIPSATPIYTPTPLPDITDYTLQADIIFEGTVVREVVSNSWPRRYEIRVSRYLKGSGYDTVYIDGYGYGSDCLPMIWEGEQRIFFVRDHDNSAGIPIYYRIMDYPPDSIETVQGLTGQSNPSQALPLDIQFMRAAENGDLNWFYIPLSIAIALLGSVILILSLRFSKRRKSKAKREELL
jgi:hypothetical protein